VLVTTVPYMESKLIVFLLALFISPIKDFTSAGENICIGEFILGSPSELYSPVS
jgi:hypothetical protein